MRSVSTIGIMLAMMGLYPLSGQAQEPTEGVANPVVENGVNANKPPANDAPAMAEGAGADRNHPSLNESPATSESSGALSPTDKVVARFMTLDTDASGSVSFEEYMTMVQKRAEARYAAMDTNGDGEVSDKEYRAFWKSRMAHWYRPKR